MTQDQNPSLGEFLRHERERRGITVEQVASATKIGIRQLQSLETDNFADLPAKPFIRGFVISYCRFIGLDAKEVLTRFSDFIDRKAQDRPTRDAGHSGYAFEKREGEQTRTVLWVVLAGFMVFGAMVFLFLKPSLHRHRSSHLEKLRASHSGKGTEAVISPSGEAEKPVAQASSPASTGAPSATATPAPAQTVAVVATPTTTPEPVATPAPSPNASPNPKDPLNSGADLTPKDIKYKAIFKALANVLVRYQVDDRPMMRFPLKKDRVLVLRAQNAIRFQASNSKSIAVLFQSKEYRPMSELKNSVVRQNTPTLFIPAELAKTIQEPFPGQKGLPPTSPPVESTAQPLSTPSP